MVVIGAGFGGVAAAVALREAGFDDVLILDRADGVGGVWRDNTYPTGVRSADGREHACDVIVYATGFRTGQFVAPLKIIGDGGLELEEVWRAGGPHAYLGMSVPGFPNMFLVYGPNTNTASESVIYFHEQQAAYVVQAAQHLAGGGHPLRVRPDVDRRYDQEIQARLAGGVWTACTNWYRAPDGRVVTNWPGTYREYRRRTRALNPADFEPGEARDP